MRIGIVGSRNLTLTNLETYLPEQVTEIVSGGARGVDTCAKEYAIAHNLKYTEFVPEYSRYGRGAPLKRNQQIVEYADIVIAFWDGKSKGTKFTIDYCKKIGKSATVFMQAEGSLLFIDSISQS